MNEYDSFVIVVLFLVFIVGVAAIGMAAALL
jgi:hypothetical protein